MNTKTTRINTLQCLKHRKSWLMGAVRIRRIFIGYENRNYEFSKQSQKKGGNTPTTIIALHLVKNKVFPC